MEIKNQGEDAFKPETYGDMIILERKILQSTSTTILKSYEGVYRMLLEFNFLFNNYELRHSGTFYFLNVYVNFMAGIEEVRLS